MSEFFELEQILPLDKDYFSVQYTNGVIIRCFIIRKGDNQMIRLNGTEKELKEYYK